MHASRPCYSKPNRPCAGFRFRDCNQAPRFKRDQDSLSGLPIIPELKPWRRPLGNCGLDGIQDSAKITGKGGI